MTRYDRLMDRLARGDTVLMDGGTGTELERRGVPQLENAWNGGATLSHPAIVEAIHADYIGHGADIVISNTFGAGRHNLADAGVPDQFETCNRHAVALAIAAREAQGRADVLVAGGISYWSFTADEPPPDRLADGIARQAAVMREAGADLLILEMMVGIDRMLVTEKAAHTAGLPVWVGLSCRPNAAGQMALFREEPLEDALAALKGRDVPMLCLMHTDVGYIDTCLDILDAHWTGKVGVYAHSGGYVDGVWTYENGITPQAYADAAARWLARGVQVIGGCCGIRPDHIARLAEVV